MQEKWVTQMVFFFFAVNIYTKLDIRYADMIAEITRLVV